jgi:hypothetical protein
MIKYSIFCLLLCSIFSSCLKDEISDINENAINPFGSGNEYEGLNYLKFDSYSVEPDGLNDETLYITFSIDWSKLPYITTKPDAINLDLAFRVDLFTPDGNLLSNFAGIYNNTYICEARFEDLLTGTVASWDSIVVRVHPFLTNSQNPTTNVFYEFKIDL